MSENANTSKNGINILVNNYINSLKWSEEQATSYEAQVNYYTSFIKGKTYWEYVDECEKRTILSIKIIHHSIIVQ